MLRKCLIGSSLIISLFISSFSLAVTQHVTQASTSQGSISNQPLEVLNTQAQYGQDDDWSTYREISPDGDRFVSSFHFSSPSPEPGLQWKELKLNINTIGVTSQEQLRKFQIRDFVDAKWMTIGDNSDALDWVWHRQTLSITSGVFRYINANGDIIIRYLSNNNADVSNVDLMTIDLVEADSDGDGDWWKPTPDDALTWQWQINGTLDTSLPVDMYDVDLFDTSSEQIQALKNDGKIVICYFSAGTYEGWRPDWSVFFPFITGEQYTGNEPPFAGNMADWDERWLDITRIDLLADIMRSRLDLAVSKGCDGVEPDNMDAYTNGAETGLSLTGSDQIAYNRWIAQEAHQRSLSVGLKNDIDQLAELVDDFDWALNEQCFEFEECDAYSIFTTAGKAVFGVEYQGSPSTFCPQASAMKLYWLQKKLSLDEWRIGCEDF